MIELRPLHRQHKRAGALLSGTALCSAKPAALKRKIIVNGPVTSIRLQKQPPQPYPIAKPEGARWVMTINPQSSTHAEQIVQAKPLIDDQPEDDAPSERQTKITTLITMLRREGGATIDEMAEATSWQPHSLRGALSGILKKKLGLDVISAKVENRGRVYHLA
jgi:hypothetical protein